MHSIRSMRFYIALKNLASPGMFIFWLSVATCASAPASADSPSVCVGCEVLVGEGGTYHFWGRTGGDVYPLSITFDGNCYEVGIFDFTSEQRLHEAGTSGPQDMANPYWGVSVSRRFQLLSHGPVRPFFGFGLSYKSEADRLSVTRWDFASQAGIRFPWIDGHSIVEFTIRHWSNAGVQLPNHGQDFATLTFLLYSKQREVIRRDDFPAELRRSGIARRNVPHNADDLP